VYQTTAPSFLAASTSALSAGADDAAGFAAGEGDAAGDAPGDAAAAGDAAATGDAAAGDTGLAASAGFVSAGFAAGAEVAAGAAAGAGWQASVSTLAAITTGAMRDTSQREIDRGKSGIALTLGARGFTVHHCSSSARAAQRPAVPMPPQLRGGAYSQRLTILSGAGCFNTARAG
jgi:hypothetical protein